MHLHQKVGVALLAGLFALGLAAPQPAHADGKKYAPGPGSYDMNDRDHRYMLYSACMKAEQDDGAALLEFARHFGVVCDDGSVDEPALVACAEKFAEWAQAHPLGAKELVDRWEKEQAGGAPECKSAPAGHVEKGGSAPAPSCAPSPAQSGGGACASVAYDPAQKEHLFVVYAAHLAQDPAMLKATCQKYGLWDANGVPVEAEYKKYTESVSKYCQEHPQDWQQFLEQNNGKWAEYVKTKG